MALPPAINIPKGTSPEMAANLSGIVKSIRDISSSSQKVKVYYVEGPTGMVDYSDNDTWTDMTGLKCNFTMNTPGQVVAFASVSALPDNLQSIGFLGLAVNKSIINGTQRRVEGTITQGYGAKETSTFWGGRVGAGPCEIKAQWQTTSYTWQTNAYGTSLMVITIEDA